MQFRFIVSLIVFLGSYLPLSLILLAQDYQYNFIGASFCIPYVESNCTIPFKNATYSLSVFAVCLVCFFVSLGALSTANPKMPIDIKEAKYVPAELMSYTLPYVVSFMSLDYQETGKFVGLIIFLCWIFIITYRSGQLILNPLLIVLGWRLYEIKFTFPGNQKEHIGRALSMGALQPGQRYDHTFIQDVAIIKSNKKGG